MLNSIISISIVFGSVSFKAVTLVGEWDGMYNFYLSYWLQRKAAGWLCKTDCVMVFSVIASHCIAVPRLQVILKSVHCLK